MNRYFSLLATVLLLLAAQTPSQNAPSADVVLQKVADKLASVKLLGYRYRFEFRYPSQGRFVEEKANGFFDLRPDNGSEQFRYQFSTETRLSIYNGSERFITDDKTRKLFVETNPSFATYGDILLQNSPLSLKYALPKLIANKTITKKLTIGQSGGREIYLIEFSLPKAAINSIGEIFELRVDQTSNYRLAIDTKTFLPIEVEQTNDEDDEALRATFDEMTENPAIPQARSWYFSTYQSEYTLEKRDKLTLIEAGKTPPKFNLAGFESKAPVSLDQFKGKLILLEFWIAHCGFCISAVPKLNEISQKFQEKGLNVVSINMYDSSSTIGLFQKRNKPEFVIITGGDSIAVAYGVEAYPAFVLIGRSGKVVYSSSGLDEKDLESAIIANL